MYKGESSIDRTKVCPKCSYDRVAKGETKCPICYTKLVKNKRFESNQPVSQIAGKKGKSSSQEKKKEAVQKLVKPN